MWTPDLWLQWSASVESASGSAWVAGDSVGTLQQVIDGKPAGWAHVTYDGEHVITPWGTPSGKDSRTVLRSGDVIGSASRWVTGPGAVKMRKTHAAHAERTTAAINKAQISDHAESLVKHLQGVGILASFSEGSVSDRQAEVRATLESGGSLTVALYIDGSAYIRSAAGPARGLEILAAAVDDWETKGNEAS